MFALCAHDHPTKNHINTCGEESRTQKKQEGLGDIDMEVVFVLRGKCSPNVSRPFNLNRSLVRTCQLMRCAYRILPQ